MEILFDELKATKNTVRFEEVEEEYGTNIGSLYVQKHALKELGFKSGNRLKVTLEVIE